MVHKTTRRNRTPDQMALKLTENAMETDEYAGEDPLLKLAGVFESKHADIAMRHGSIHPDCGFRTD